MHAYIPHTYIYTVLVYKFVCTYVMWLLLLVEMKVLTFLSLFINISVQTCTIKQFQTNASSMVMSTEAASDKVVINSTYYNCLSRSDTSDHYSSMSVSILYNIKRQTVEVRYNLQCKNGDWEIVNRQPTALRSNASYNCSDCTNRTVNDYHCTSKLFSVYILIHVSHRF